MSNSYQEPVRIYDITNNETADLAIEQIKDKRQRADEFIRIANGKIERLQEQIEQQEQAYQSETDFLFSLLNDYLNRENPLARDTKTMRLLELPSGKFVRKVARPRMVADRDKLSELLKDTEYVTYEPKLAWGELKKQLDISGDAVVLKDTGEVIDGVSVEYSEETFAIE